MKKGLLAIIILSLLGCTRNVSSQNNLKIDSTLTSIYKKFRANMYDYGNSSEEGRDTILTRFKNTLEKTLKNQDLNKVSYDSLQTYIQILISKDNKLKIFSWDQLNVGTWSRYNSMYQFKIENNLFVGFLPIKDESGERIASTDISHYKINKVDNDSYLVKGYGTHGSGKEFYVFRLLRFVNNEIKDCIDCFNGEDRFFYEIGRGKKELIPKYNSKTKEISYHELTENFIDGDKNSPSGFMDPTGKIIKLQYKNGVFVKSNH